jgi:hypothetical protein
MIRRTLVIAVWLAVGAALLGGLYWLFLNTPESNALTLTASALLVMLIVATAAIVANVAVLLALGGTVLSSLRPATRYGGWFLAVAFPASAIVWAITLGESWTAQRSGEISAWFIAQVGWSDITPFFTAERYISVWLRWVLVPVASTALLASRLAPADGARRRWLAGIWHWRTLAIATLAFVMLVALPWRAAFWRTAGLPPTWIEPAVAVIRLTIVTMLIAIGFAVMVMASARQITQATNHAES